METMITEYLLHLTEANLIIKSKKYVSVHLTMKEFLTVLSEATKLSTSCVTIHDTGYNILFGGFDYEFKLDK